jgi:hypothetical protein
MRTLSIRVDDETFAAITDAARRDRRTVTAWVSLACEQRLADQLEREQREGKPKRPRRGD